LKNSILNHSDTPLFLKAVNARLTACLTLSSDDFSSEQFRYLSQIRHKVILRALSRMPPDQRTDFAKQELEINRKLEELAQGLLGNAKDEVVKYSRGRAAVNKYK